MHRMVLGQPDPMAVTLGLCVWAGRLTLVISRSLDQDEWVFDSCVAVF